MRSVLDYLPLSGHTSLRSVVTSVFHLVCIVLILIVPGILIKKGVLPTHYWESLFNNAFWGEHGLGKNRLAAYGLFVLSTGLLIGIGFPRLWVSSIAGGIFGVTAGIALSLTASVFGAAIVFQAGRFLLPGRLKARLNRALFGLADLVKNHTFSFVLYARLFPFSNSTAVSLFSGACRADFIQFVVASLVGFLPLTIAFCLVGNGSAKLQGWPIFLGFGLMILFYATTAIFRKFFQKKSSPDRVA
jgi:uncharacterized membrane protein YdjX (TVP38/TMEM64 family)